MTKKEVMDYVTETPQNVNKNILGQKLDAFQKNVSCGYDLLVVYDDNRNVRLLKGSYSAAVEKLVSGSPVVMELYEVYDVDNPFVYSHTRRFVSNIQVYDHGLYFYYDYDQGKYVFLGPDNQVSLETVD